MAAIMGLGIRHVGTASKAVKLVEISRNFEGLKPGWDSAWPFLLP